MWNKKILPLYKGSIFYYNSSRFLYIIYYSNTEIDKYLKPVSGNITTMFLPLFSCLWANALAVWTAAPEDILTSSPSVFTGSLVTSKDSSLVTCIISSSWHSY